MAHKLILCNWGRHLSPFALRRNTHKHILLFTTHLHSFFTKFLQFFNCIHSCLTKINKIHTSLSVWVFSSSFTSLTHGWLSTTIPEGPCHPSNESRLRQVTNAFHSVKAYCAHVITIRRHWPSGSIYRMPLLSALPDFPNFPSSKAGT